MHSQENSVKIPVFKNLHLSGSDALNESKLYILLQRLSPEERKEVLSLSIDEILEKAVSAEQLEVNNSRNFYSPSNYQQSELFWMSLADLMEKRQKYINLL